jgi:drug/metabolite transporter (DMT)-like permease
MSNLILLISMTLLGALGGFFFKKASGVSNNKLTNTLLFLAIGGSLYFTGALLNIALLKKLPYSVVFPLTSITYIWTMILSYFFLNEKITFRKLVGIAFIAAGCLLLTL